MRNLLLLVLSVLIFHDLTLSQYNWKYISDETHPAFYFASIEAPNNEIIVLENNEVKTPNFRSESQLLRFNFRGKLLGSVNITIAEPYLFCSDLLQHEKYFLLMGLIGYPSDSQRTDLFIRRYDYDFNLLDEKIYPHRSYPAISMRTKLINGAYYITSINTQDRTTRIPGQSLFKLDTFGNLLYFKENLPNTFISYPYDFISSSNNGFIGIAGSGVTEDADIIHYSDSLNVISVKSKNVGVNAGSNFFYLLDRDSSEFFCYWLDNFQGNPNFDIGLSVINKGSLTSVKKNSYGTMVTDDQPTFNRGIQKIGNDGYYISGGLNYGIFSLASFDTTTVFASRLDNELNTVWSRFINLGKYFISYNNLVTSDSGLLINGMVSVPFPGPFLPHGCLIKIGKNGEFDEVVSTMDNSNIDNILVKKLADRIIIEISDPNKEITFHFTDINGKEIIPSRILDYKINEVMIPSLPAGVYPYLLLTKDKHKYAGKIIVTR